MSIIKFEIPAHVLLGVNLPLTEVRGSLAKIYESQSEIRAGTDGRVPSQLFFHVRRSDMFFNSCGGFCGQSWLQ